MADGAVPGCGAVICQLTSRHPATSRVRALEWLLLRSPKGSPSASNTCCVTLVELSRNARVGRSGKSK